MTEVLDQVIEPEPVEAISEPYSGYLEGWRVWSIKTDMDGAGTIVGISSLWQDNERHWIPFKPKEAYCELRRYDYELSPRYEVTFEEDECVRTSFLHSCGLHAWPDEEEVLRYGVHPIGYKVIGRVALWGNIVVHDKGYRAQFAYPLSFDYLVHPKNACFANQLFLKERSNEDILNELRIQYGLL